MYNEAPTALEMIEERILQSGGNTSDFDLDAMEADFNNGNLNLDTADIMEYNTQEVVIASIINGQFKQAKNQAREFGHDFDSLYFYVKGRQWEGD